MPHPHPTSPLILPEQEEVDRLAAAHGPCKVYADHRGRQIVYAGSAPRDGSRLLYVSKAPAPAAHSPFRLR